MRYIVAILIFAGIILFHEFGHFIFAKACNVKVNEFQIGFGPRLVGFTKGETTYSIKAIPLGGACIMEGEDDDSQDGRAFNNKPVWQRFLITFAGPAFNFILAFLLSLILLGAMGYQEPNVTEVTEGYPAQEAGISAGDTIVKLDHYRIHFYNEVSLYLYLHAGESVDVTYSHEGILHTVTLTPVYNEEAGRYLMGIVSTAARTRGNAWETITHSIYNVKYEIYMTFESLGMLIRGQIGMDSVSGPVGVVAVISDTYQEAAKDGALYIVMNMINIAILLSANLGVMNLIPFPALDGGRIFMLIIEAIRRKKVNPNVEGYINMAGFVILMVFMIFVMGSDFYKIFNGGF